MPRRMASAKSLMLEAWHRKFGQADGQNAEYWAVAMRISRLYFALCALAALSLSSNVFAQEVKPKPKAPKVKAPRAKKRATPTKTKRPAKTPAKLPKKNSAKKPAKLPKKSSAKKAAKSAEAAAIPFQGMLGVMVGRLTPKKRVSLGAPPMAGLQVSKVVPGTIASVAGVKPNDVIIDVAGATIRDVSDVKTALGQMNVGDLLTLQVIRKGKPKTLFATLSNKTLKMSRFGDYPETGTATSSLDGKLHFVSGDFAERQISWRMRKLKKRIRKLKKRRKQLRWRRYRKR